MTLSKRTKVRGASARSRAAEWSGYRAELLSKPAVRIVFDALKFRRRISRELAGLRKRSGLTQVDLAKRAGTTQASIARFESGKGGVPTLLFLQRVAAALGKRVSITIEEAT